MADARLERQHGGGSGRADVRARGKLVCSRLKRFPSQSEAAAKKLAPQTKLEVAHLALEETCERRPRVRTVRGLAHTIRVAAGVGAPVGD